MTLMYYWFIQEETGRDGNNPENPFQAIKFTLNITVAV